MAEGTKINRQARCGRREVLVGSGDKNKNCCNTASCSRLLQYGESWQIAAIYDRLLQYSRSCVAGKTQAVWLRARR
jgi:hypothetical protein